MRVRASICSAVLLATALQGAGSVPRRRLAAVQETGQVQQLDRPPHHGLLHAREDVLDPGDWRLPAGTCQPYYDADLSKSNTGVLPAVAQADAVGMLKTRWIAIVGDSAARILFGGLVARLNGTLEDRHFGSWANDERGKCQKNCLREYVDLKRGLRVTFMFLTYMKLSKTLAGWDLSSASVRPDVVVTACGAWDLHVNTHSKSPGGKDNPFHRTPKNVISEAVNDLSGWLVRLRNKFGAGPLIVNANVVACNRNAEFRDKVILFNSGVREQANAWLAADSNLILVDREPSTINSTMKTGEMRCDAFHAYGPIALHHVDLMLYGMGCRQRR